MGKCKDLVQKKQNKGSISIEASLSLTFFVFFMIGVISLINICRIQVKVGNALHMAALDISHMSYLLEITGIYELSVDIQNGTVTAGQALQGHAEKADQVLAGTEALLETFGGGLQTVAEAELNPTSIQNAMAELNTAIQNGEQQVAALSGSTSELVADLRGITQNPIKFVKTLVRYGIGQGVGAAQNWMAGIFAEALIQDHLEAGGVITDADSYLEQMGVTEGLEGMHFTASSIFGGDDNTDINLIVAYDVELFPFFGDTFTMHVVQSASTRAWLSGDVRTQTELPEVSEEEPEEEQSVWTEGNSITENNTRARALREQFHAAHNTDTYIRLSTNSRYYGYESSTNTLYTGQSVDIYSSSYRNADGSFNVGAIGWENNLRDRLSRPVNVMPEGGGQYALPTEEDIHFEFVIQIPENSTDADVAALQASVDAWMAANGSNLPEGVAGINIEIIKVGGNTPHLPAAE